jgi:hypothetical protein
MSPAPDLKGLHADMLGDLRQIKADLVCSTPGHDWHTCRDCHARRRRLRAVMQDGEVRCEECGDLGYILIDGPILAEDQLPVRAVEARCPKRCGAARRRGRGAGR